MIWNNDPSIVLSNKAFRHTRCSPSKLEITNSPTNQYFAARYIACTSAKTPYCFVQDDDYLITPEVVRALRFDQSVTGTHSDIHLLPAHEILSSHLRKLVTLDSQYHSIFAWLGYGAVISRSKTSAFLESMTQIELGIEHILMADNYYTILSNSIPELWFDQGISLGLGQAFTFALEGDERNWKHIEIAKDSLIKCVDDLSCKVPFVDKRIIREIPALWKAPCRNHVCVVATNIELLPPLLSEMALRNVSLRELERNRGRHLSEDTQETFVQNPLSFLVDGHANTSFCSTSNGKMGEFIILELFRPVDHRKTAVKVFFPAETDSMLKHLRWSFSYDKAVWLTSYIPECLELDLGRLECLLRPSDGPWKFFRLQLSSDAVVPWRILELQTHKLSI